MQTSFNSHSLAEIFRDLYLRERTGVLTLRCDEVVRRVHFDRGLIVFADSTVDSEALGPFLVRNGALSSVALSKIAAGTNDARRVARALVERGLIEPPALAVISRKYVAQVVGSAFRWEDGTAGFTETDPDAPTPFDSDVLVTCELILHGIAKMVGFEAIGAAMLGLDNKLRIRRPSPLPIEELKLSPAHGFILSRVDGAATCQEVLTTLPPGEEDDATRFLFGLLLLGVVEYDPALGDGPVTVASVLRDHADRQALERMQIQTIQTSYEQMRSQTPYEILGVTPTASVQAIDRAYEEAKALFSRDRMLPRVREQFRSELAVIESRLVEAFIRLTQPETKAVSSQTLESEEEQSDLVGVRDLLVRVEMDKAKSKVQAEKAARVADAYFSKARQAIREGDYHNAIQYGKLAISFNENDARYYAMLAECQVRNPEGRWQRLAEQNFTKATELDPWNADYWLSLGRFYRRRGLTLRARRQFEEVLRLVPRHRDALHELENLH